jgi:hypothetical protein
MAATLDLRTESEQEECLQEYEEHLRMEYSGKYFSEN